MQPGYPSAYLVGLKARAAQIHYRAIDINVAHVEQLVILQAVDTTGRVIGSHIVQVTEFASQVKMGLVN